MVKVSPKVAIAVARAEGAVARAALAWLKEMERNGVADARRLYAAVRRYERAKERMRGVS